MASVCICRQIGNMVSHLVRNPRPGGSLDSAGRMVVSDG